MSRQRKKHPKVVWISKEEQEATKYIYRNNYSHGNMRLRRSCGLNVRINKHKKREENHE